MRLLRRKVKKKRKSRSRTGLPGPSRAFRGLRHPLGRSAATGRLLVGSGVLGAGLYPELVLERALETLVLAPRLSPLAAAERAQNQSAARLLVHRIVLDQPPQGRGGLVVVSGLDRRLRQC